MRVIARMNVGGPAWQVSVLTRGLNDDDFSTTLVCGQVEPGEGDFIALRDPSLPVSRIGTLGRSLRVMGDLRTLFELWRLMRREQPDIVHTHTAKAGVLGRVAAMGAGVPIRCHTFHGHLLHGYFSPRTTGLVVLMERLLARGTHALVAVGDQVRRDLLDARIGKPEQFTVIAPGVAAPAAVDRASARDTLGILDNQLLVLFVGRLTAIKRVDRLIESFVIVREQCPHAVLLIAGDGDQTDVMQVQAAALGDAVRFLGWVGDLDALYVSADVVVCTSDNEGMPVTLIEASMAGVPCVSTAVGSVGEVVIDGVTGRVVDLTADAVGSAVVELLNDPDERRRLGKAACRHAAALFGADRLVADHRALYRRLPR